MTIDRRVDEWANDDSVYHRLRDCALELARGKGKWNDRARYVFERLMPIREADFPAMFQAVFARILEMQRYYSVRIGDHVAVTAGSMPPNIRRALADAVFNLYEEMLKERVRQGKE